MRVLELNVSPKFALMKQVLLNLNSIQSTMSAASSNINKYLKMQFFSHESSKGNKYFVPLFFNDSMKSKFRL